MEIITNWLGANIHDDERAKLDDHIKGLFHDEQIIALFREEIQGPVTVDCSYEIQSSTTFAVAFDRYRRRVAIFNINWAKDMQTNFEALV